MANIKDETLVSVRNLVDHHVIYKLPEENVRRDFNAFEVKKISAGELRKVNYTVGGHVLLTGYLCVENASLAQEFGVDTDVVEYNWTKEDVDRVLTEGDLDELLDALDFAPDGIVDLIKDRAVELKINDYSKRKAISDKLGVDVSGMIDVVEQSGAGTSADTAQKPATKQRRRSTKAAE
jgi:hypothetical protein